MDKNFNDEELSDIMKEIEALEKGDEDSKDVLEGLTELKESEAIPLRPQAKQTSAPGSKSNQTSMSFKVQGDLHLELQFDVGGKMVCMNVTEEGLLIEMDGGMTFSVPLHKKSA